MDLAQTRRRAWLQMSGPLGAARRHRNRRRGTVEKESDLPLVERITFYRGCLGGSEACEISSAGCRLMQHRILPRPACLSNITTRGRKESSWDSHLSWQKLRNPFERYRRQFITRTSRHDTNGMSGMATLSRGRRTGGRWRWFRG